MRVSNDLALSIRAVCKKYVGCTGCPLAGGAVTYFGDSTIVCESGRGKASSEQRARDDSDSTNQTRDGKGKE